MGEKHYRAEADHAREMARRAARRKFATPTSRSLTNTMRSQTMQRALFRSSALGLSPRVGYHLVEKKNAVTTDATVAIATKVAGSAISAFQAMIEIILVLFLSD